MHGHVLVALLKAVVLSDVVEVVSADDDGPLHLHLGHHARQDPPSDGDVTSKRAFLVNVGALDGLLRCLEAQADVLVVSRELLLASFAKQDPLLILKDGRLLLVGTLGLPKRRTRQVSREQVVTWPGKLCKIPLVPSSPAFIPKRRPPRPKAPELSSKTLIQIYF